ncbi:transcriptional regulator [Actinosynnema pretiosum]|uniref:Transcriptional regulator n=1 Tax=Actinosynnema pretiosum TaxID=42197 RepID=A0A290ZGA6_9PSEU|nr:transcriptional regulator [Actinosynnema pretiosum]
MPVDFRSFTGPILGPSRGLINYALAGGCAPRGKWWWVKRRRRYECGLDVAIDVVDGRWKALLLWALETGPHRFGALRRMLPPVTEKVLAEQLRQMESDGLVAREVFPEAVLRVEYSLTARGRSLNEALRPLGEWGAANRAHVESVRTP